MSTRLTTVTVNGGPEAPAASLAELVARRRPDATGVAVALDGEVVPRAGWASTPVPGGSVVEIVVAVQGG